MGGVSARLVNLPASGRDQGAMGTIVIFANQGVVQLAAALALCAIACGLVLVTRVSVSRVTASRDWPSVPGVVIETAVAAGSDGRRQRFRPVVRYRYEVGGERFEGSRIRWGALLGFRKFTRARRLLDGYAAGSRVAVYHHPLRPSLAVLEPSAAAGIRPALLIAPAAAFCMLFVVGSVIAGL
jgi:hypothetical protein